MSIMGNVAGLGAVQPDWAQSDGQFADFIRNKPDIPAIEQNVERLRQLAEGALPKEGGTMTGTLSLGGNALKGLSAPKEADDAATKSYVDSAAVCTVFVQAALAADGWTGSGPYTQRVSCEGITGEDRPHWGIVYSGTAENKLAQREAFSLVDELDTEENSLVFPALRKSPVWI